MSLIKNNDSDNFYPVAIPEVGWKCDWLWSTHRGCPFNCVYCSSKRWNKRFGGDPCEVFGLKSEWKIQMGFPALYRPLPNASVFINPYIDIMALPEYDRKQVFEHVLIQNEWWFDRYEIGHKEQYNFTPIFQTKKPSEYFDYLDFIPSGSWLGTTIETDDFLEYGNLGISKAPSVYDRYVGMVNLRDWINTNPQYKLFVTIEPIIKCSVFVLSKWVRRIKPDLIFIGCDSGKNNLPEPSREELIKLIEALKQITHVHVKSNAKRILGDMTLHNWFAEKKIM